jgi:hypothetical protein
MQLTWPRVLAWRVHQHHLSEPAPASDFLDVAERICGLHAQVMSSAELTLWARTDGLARTAVQQALWQDRQLIKIWAMRGTLHLFTAAEYPVWQAALSITRRYQTPAWFAYYNVTPEEFDELTRAIGAVLDDKLLTRSTLAEQVSKHTGKPHLGEAIANSSWGSMLKPATMRGYLCFAPSEGQNVRFTRPSSWLRKFKPIDADAGLREVVRRYLHTYGPASQRDFAAWWGTASMPSVRRPFQELADDLAEVELDGKKGWLLKSDLSELQSARPTKTVRLLPAFDQYVVGAPRGEPAVLRPDLKPRVYRNQGWFTPVLLVDGRMVGVWRHTRSGSRLSVTIEAFEELPSWVRRGAEREAQRLAEFLGGKLELAWGPLGAGKQVQEESADEAAG